MGRKCFALFLVVCLMYVILLSSILSSVTQSLSLSVSYLYLHCLWTLLAGFSCRHRWAPEYLSSLRTALSDHNPSSSAGSNARQCELPTNKNYHMAHESSWFLDPYVGVLYHHSWSHCRCHFNNSVLNWRRLSWHSHRICVTRQSKDTYVSLTLALTLGPLYRRTCTARWPSMQCTFLPPGQSHISLRSSTFR